MRICVTAMYDCKIACGRLNLSVLRRTCREGVSVTLTPEQATDLSFDHHIHSSWLMVVVVSFSFQHRNFTMHNLLTENI